MSNNATAAALKPSGVGNEYAGSTMTKKMRSHAEPHSSNSETIGPDREEGPLVQAPLRINLRLSPRTAARLDQLRQITDVSSNTDVVRNALRVYDLLVAELCDGKELCLRDKKGHVTALKMLYLDPHL